ncbi:MAG TPA: exodeoxyribonuclease V subunit gamma [Polyangiaceae bacterium]|nr:exodeoxyribonuclease V subunit gamma [Polyangiaceae bacterium]
MFIYRSNRTEQLAGALAEVVRRPLASPLSPEVIVVSSQGIERWLSQQLAARIGVFANARFPFPRAFMSELLTPVGEKDPFAREALSWSIAALLPAVSREPGAEAVASYLSNDEHGQKLFDLADELANAFDQYVVYRPELVRAWERGAGRGFQPDLFRALVARHGSKHLAARAASFLSGALPSAAPERVCVFGTSSLPRLYVRLLARLGKEREVHLFLLRGSPSALEQNPLAASLGRLSREFEQVLLEEDAGAKVVDLFVDPGKRTMLEVVQADLLAGAVREPGSQVATRVVARPGDVSIVAHSCHGPLREVEVLRDQLIAAFEADPTLAPEDVAVMAPDIDQYAPLVDAVFGVDAEEPGFIPYKIADRRVRASNPAAEALLRVVELAGSRMKASDVLDLLQLEPVRDRLGIDAEELPVLRRLVRESGVRWGIDEQHRESLGQPRSRENTWQFGLDRLLLGCALSNDDAAFANALPFPIASGELAELAGKLSEAATNLFEARRALLEPRTPSEWASTLTEILERLVSSEDEHLPLVQATRDALEGFRATAEAAGFTERVHREALGSMLARWLDQEKSGRSFLSGGVTFCALLPMRSIPFRIVYLLGLSDTAFPRRDRAPAFDLIAQHPEPGDRSSREEDRLLFLEALLSARQRFIVSFVGRAAHDNAELAPSAVVAELLDTLDRTFSTTSEREGQLPLALDDHRVARDGLGRRAVVEHPLQAFSARYFGASHDARLFSYGEAEAEGARALAARDVRAPRFASTPLLDPALSVIELTDLVRFLENPARAFFQRRLGVILEDEPSLLSDRDPVELSPLETYELGARLLEQLARGRDEASARDWARGLGLAPPGAPGDIDVRRAVGIARRLLGLAADFLDGEPRPPIAFDLSLTGARLAGVLRDVRTKGQAIVRFARLKPKNELAAWTRHLALCAAGAAGGGLATLVLGRAKADDGRTARNKYDDARVEGRVFEPVPADVAKDHLEELARLYRIGQRAPLCLFPTASKLFVERWAAAAGKPDRERSALSAARKAFNERNAGAECDDPYVRRIFGGVDPFGPVSPFDVDGDGAFPSFAETALAVFEPLLANSRPVPS